MIELKLCFQKFNLILLLVDIEGEEFEGVVSQVIVRI